MNHTFDPPFVAETLAWCNERRLQIGEPPLERLPKGHREDPHSCPCGQAAGLYVDYLVARDPAGNTIDLPKAVQHFVVNFDNGDLPQYDIEYDREP